MRDKGRHLNDYCALGEQPEGVSVPASVRPGGKDEHEVRTVRTGEGFNSLSSWFLFALNLLPPDNARHSESTEARMLN